MRGWVGIIGVLVAWTWTPPQAVVSAIGGQAAALQSAGRAGVPAAVAIRNAVVARVGTDADVTVLSVDTVDAEGPYREARPDPGARTSHPIRFTLLRETGAPASAVATVRVVGPLVVPVHPIGRSAAVTATDVTTVRAEWRDLPLRLVPTLAEIVGGRTLRPLAAGAPIVPGAVVLRRAVEAGDRVTVLAATGAVEVSAEMVASDGGRIGDVVRVVIPDTRRFLRARVVRKGVVEVTNER